MDEVKDRKEIIVEAFESAKNEESAQAKVDVAPIENKAPSEAVEPVKEVKTEKVSTEKVKTAKTDAPIVDVKTEPIIEKIASPKSLKKELADKYWDKLDPELQKAIVQREEDSAKGFEAYKTQADFGKNVEYVIAPYMATINQIGLQPHQAVGELFKVDHTLRYGQPHEKIGMMQRIFRDYGINPQTVFDSFTQQQPQIDPALAPVYNELQGLKAQQQQWLMQQQDRENDMLLNEVMTFAEGKEHINVVQDEMMALLPQIIQTHPNISYQEKLQKAYDMAIWARPELRETFLQQEREKVTASASSAEFARKQQAANVSIKGSTPALGGGAKQMTRRDIIASQLNS
jgi:hypothetical protein